MRARLSVGVGPFVDRGAADCNDDVDRPGGESDKSRQIDAMMNNIGKYASVKLLVKYDGERYFWNVKELEFVEPDLECALVHE